MALALLESAWLASILLKRRGRNGELIWDGVIWAAILGIIGARIGYIATNWSDYAIQPLSVFYVNQGGLSFHGGIIGGILGCWLYFRRTNLRFIEVMDAAAPGVAIGIMLVRFIGNLSNGDILGFKVSPSKVPWALNFPLDEYHEFGQKASEFIPRHPTEIYGGLVGLILLIIALLIWFKKTVPGTNFYAFILGYSLIRSVIEEPFRNVPHYIYRFNNEVYGFGGVTMTQWVSIPLIFIAIYGLYAVRRKGSREDWDKSPAELAGGERIPARREKRHRRIMPERLDKKRTDDREGETEKEKTPRKPFTK